MPRFHYKAKYGPDKIEEGIIVAETLEQALDKIQAKGLFPIQLRPEELEFKKGLHILRLFSPQVRPQDLAVFTRQLTDLLKSGLDLHRALRVLLEQAENPLLQRLIEQLAGFLKDGESFSQGLSHFPQIFPSFYVSMVKTAEAAGKLERVLERLADYIENQEEIKSNIRTALAYPLLLLVISLITIVILLAWVVPRLSGIFTEMGQALPLPTQILLGISSGLTKGGICILIVFGLVVIMTRRWLDTERGRFMADGLKMKIPLFGRIINRSQLARFCRTLATLLESGVPMLFSLEIVSGLLTNEVLKRELLKVKTEVQAGSSFAKALKDSRRFPPMLVNLVAVGEEGGGLEKALLRIAESYEHEVGRFTKVATSLLEPIMILSMGLVVVFIVSAMLLPIFQMNLMAR